MHLEHIASLLDTYENFHVCILGNMNKNNYMVYAKEDIGVLVTGINTPSFILFMNESNIFSAFWDFLKNEVVNSTYESLDNRNIAEKLRNFIVTVKSCFNDKTLIL